MYTEIITEQGVIDEVAAHFPATLSTDDEGLIVTVPDGVHVAVLGLDRDVCGDPTRVALQVEMGAPDDWITATVDLSGCASMDPDEQLRDTLAESDRAAAAALTDEASGVLAAMAGDWVHDLGLVVRAFGDPDCEHDPGDRSRGFEIVALMCGDEADFETWPAPYGDDTAGWPLTAEHAAERAAAMLHLDSRVLDAWADQARDTRGEMESDLTLSSDMTWYGSPVVRVLAAGDGESTEDWPAIEVIATVRADGCDITAGVWDGSQSPVEISAACMSPRQALVAALGRLLGRELPQSTPGDGALARWSREVAAQDA